MVSDLRYANPHATSDNDGHVLRHGYVLGVVDQ